MSTSSSQTGVPLYTNFDAFDVPATFFCGACQRSFSSGGALNYHIRTCGATKKRTGGALEKVREAWKQTKARKRQRLDDDSSSLITDELPPENRTVDLLLIGQPTPCELEAHHAPTERSTALSTSSQSRNNISLTLVEEHNPPSIAEGRPRRDRKTPGKFRDFIPQSNMPLLNLNPVTQDPSSLQEDTQSEETPMPHNEDAQAPSSTTRLFKLFKSPRNIFGLSRTFYSTEFPLHDPEKHITLQDLDERAKRPTHPTEPSNLTVPFSDTAYHPYPNKSSFALGNWYWNHGVQKSQQSFKTLLDIIADPDFDSKEIQNTRWKVIDQTLGLNDFDEYGAKSEWEDEDAGWKRTPITLDIPFHRLMKTKGTQRKLVGDLYHRSIVSVIREKLANVKDDKNFHYEPCELSWSPTSAGRKTRVYGELYTSPAFLAAHRKLQDSDPEPECSLPRCVVALMLWSDATHLTSFGNSKLWPAYLFFGNESKYHRCKPSMNLANHIAYFQSLPDSFKDFASEHVGGKGPNAVFLAHCNREMFHAQWAMLLDDEFINAYRHGIVVTCLDGLKRRFYPRILTYSADYPEKVLLASIRNRGSRPCPRCTIPMAGMRNMGMKNDMKQRVKQARIDDNTRQTRVESARRLIYDGNWGVNSAPVERLLKPDSLVPVSNAFSNKLKEFDFNFFQMLVVDILHDWEIGVWKATFIHLIRILYAVDAATVNELDSRFRQIPTFGRDTIRKFSTNSSEMKKFAARDYADLLQCAIPAFEGLLPEPHNSRVMDLLFVCATWHGLAKLRLHTDDTLKILDNVTISLGEAMRRFASDTTFKTRELPREAAARARQKTNKNAQKKTNPLTTAPPPPFAPSVFSSAQLAAAASTVPITTSPPVPAVAVAGPRAPAVSTRRPKTLNLETYKYHSLGDVASMIREYGTTDSYSTEIGELEHRTPKARYIRTDRKQYRKQMARIERRQARLRRIREGIPSTSKVDDLTVKQAVDPETHHTIGKTENLPVHIGSFVQDHDGDPAVQDFIPKLKWHLLPRIKSLVLERRGISGHGPSIATARPDDWQSVLLKQDRIYKHNIMRVNYTTYDVRRADDVIHVNTSHRNVMVLNPAFEEDPNEHPFWYARVLGIFHGNVSYLGDGNADHQPRRIEFLWVRWYTFEENSASGWKSKRLDRVRFPHLWDSESFGFLDPADVLRASHVVPCFSRAKSHLNGPAVSLWAEDSEEWQLYYINRFVDRDMVMRYHWGLAVGHIYAHPRVTSDMMISTDDTQTQSTPFSEDDASEEVGISNSNDPSSPEFNQCQDLDDLMMASLATMADLDITGDGYAEDEADLCDVDMVYEGDNSDSGEENEEDGQDSDEGDEMMDMDDI